MPQPTVEYWPLTQDQRDIVELVSRFAADEIRPRGRAVDEADTESPVDVFEKAAKIGITDFMLPEKFGGGGYTDVFTQCLVQEALCWGDPGIGNFVCSNGFFADPLLALGSEDQKERWLRPLTGPTPLFTALATTEPGSGSDAASIVMGTLSERGSIEPSKRTVVFWGTVMGGVAAIMLVIGGDDALNGLQQITIVAAVPFVLVMAALCVSLWKDLQTDPMVVRSRLGEEMVETAVVTGVEEHDGDFVLVVEPAEPGDVGLSDDKGSSGTT